MRRKPSFLGALLKLMSGNSARQQPKIYGGTCAVCKRHVKRLHRWHNKSMCTKCYNYFCNHVRVNRT